MDSRSCLLGRARTLACTRLTLRCRRSNRACASRALARHRRRPALGQRLRPRWVLPPFGICLGRKSDRRRGRSGPADHGDDQLRRHQPFCFPVVGADRRGILSRGYPADLDKFVRRLGTNPSRQCCGASRRPAQPPAPRSDCPVRGGCEISALAGGRALI